MIIYDYFDEDHFSIKSETISVINFT